MSYQRDGWDPKWGEEESAGDSNATAEDEVAQPTKKTRAKDPAVEVDRAWDEVETELAEDAKKKESPPAKAELSPADLGTVAIPPPIEGMSAPEPLVDTTEEESEATPLEPEEPPAVGDKSERQKKNADDD